MYRFVIRLLIVCLLSTQAAWAWDTHSLGWELQPTLASAVDHQEDADSSLCFHLCCHASAHMVGMPVIPSDTLFTSQGRLQPFAATIFISFLGSPPYQPPEA
jgi:hypothetical protein